MNHQDMETFKLWSERYRASELYSQPFFDKGKENYLLYKSYQESNRKVYRHQIFVPYSFAFLEDMASYFMLSVLASPITFTLMPRYTAVSLGLCRALESVVHWVLTDEQSEFILELEELIKNAGIFNASYLVNYPLVAERRRGLDSETFFDRLNLDAPCPLDIYVEPDIKRLSRMRWIIKKSREDYAVLKKLEAKGEYRNIDDARGRIPEDDPVKTMLADIGLSAGEGYDADSDKVELLDCFFEGNIVTIGGRRAIVRNTEEKEQKPFLFDFPILDCRFTGAPGEAFGVGLLESMKPTQHDLNDLRSQRRDNISLILNKLFIYDTMAGEVQLDSLYSAPGNVIVTTNRNALDEFPVSDVTGSSYKEEESLIYDLQSITSLWNYSRGSTPQRKETATGIIRLQQAAQSRNEWMIRKLDQYVLMPLCRRIMVYVREYMPLVDFLEIVGKDKIKEAEEFYALTTLQVQKMFKILPMTESIVSLKEMDVNQFLQAFDRLIQMPDVNRPGLIQALLLKLGQKDIKDILPEMSPGAQEAMMAAGGPQNGPGGPPMAPGGGRPGPGGPQAPRSPQGPPPGQGGR